MADFTLGYFEEEEDRDLASSLRSKEQPIVVEEEEQSAPSFTLGYFEEEEDRPLYNQSPKAVEEEVVVEEDQPLSMSPVDMMFSDPQMMMDFKARREAKREQLQDMDWSGEFTQEYEAEYGEKAEDRLSVPQVAASPKALEVMQRYLTPRIGKVAADPSTYDKPEDFVERYLEHVRSIEDNSVSFGQELGILMKDATEQSLSDAAILYLLNENMRPAGHYGDGTSGKFQNLLKAVADRTTAMVFDPINVATLGSGFFVNQGMKALGTKTLLTGLRAKLPQLIAAQGVEGTLTAWDNSNRQQARIQTGLQDDFSYAELGLDVAMGGVLTGATDFYAAKKAVQGLNAKEALDAKLGISAEERQLREETERRLRESNYDPVIGRKIREDLQRGTLWENLNTADPSVVEPELRAHVQKNLAEALTDWASNNRDIASRLRDTGADKDVRITDVVHDLIYTGQFEIAGDLADALKRAGVTTEQFSHAFRGSIEDAARTLGSWGAFKRKLDGIAEVSPELAKAFERMQDMPTTLTNDIISLAQKGDRGLRSLLVTAPVTTVRNVVGNTLHMSLDTFTDLADNIIYNIAYRKENGQGVGGAIWDSFKVAGENIARFGKQAEQDEVLSRVLKNHSSIENRLMNYVQDGAVGAGDSKMSKVIDSLQFFNRAQDQFFRKAIFNNRVDFYLRRNNLGTLTDYLKESKPIPKEILIKSMEESLDRTFSKQYRGTDAASSLIQVVERLAPVSTYFIPFPRYTMNAMEFVYKHSPMGVVDVAYSMGKSEIKQRAGKEGAELTEEQLLEMQKRTVQSLTGTAMLYGFYKYAETYPDEEWNIIKDEESGDTSDVTTIGPIAIYKMLATAIYRLDNDMPLNMTLADVNEAITGLQLTGSGGLEEDAGVVLRALVSGEEQTQEESRFMEKLGFAVGSHVGRGLQPIAWISDLVAAIDTEEGVVRNRKVLSEEGGFSEAFGNTIKNRLPFFKQDLPPYVSATRMGNMTRYNPLGTLVTGFRQEPAQGLAEVELRKHGIQPWTIGPYKKDPAVRDMIVREMQPFINIMMEEELLSDPRYMYANRDAQSIMIKNWISDVVTPMADELATANETPEKDAKGNKFSRIQREAWRKLPKSYRNLVNEQRKELGIPSVEDSHEYLEGAMEAEQFRSLM